MGLDGVDEGLEEELPKLGLEGDDVGREELLPPILCPPLGRDELCPPNDE